MRKLTIVGSGSAMFTRGLVADAIRSSRCLPGPEKAPARVDGLPAAPRRHLPQFA